MIMDMKIEKATFEDLPKILELQKSAYLSEAELLDDYTIQPLTQVLDELQDEYKKCTILKVIDNDNIIGSVRAFEAGGRVYVGKLIVHPNYQNKGVGSKLLDVIETHFESRTFELFTSSRSEKNLHIYKKHGYKEFKRERVNKNYEFVFLEKHADV